MGTRFSGSIGTGYPEDMGGFPGATAKFPGVSG